MSKRAEQIVRQALGQFKSFPEKGIEKITNEVSILERLFSDDDLYTVTLCLGKSYLEGYNAGIDRISKIYKELWP